MKTVSILFILYFAFTAHAATFTVTRTDDRNSVCISGSDCSLREAVQSANGSSENDVINFQPGITRITLNNEIVIASSGSLVIQGNGADVFTIDGGFSTSNRIFNTINLTLTLSDVTLTEGNGAGFRGEGNGGAMYVENGSLTLDRVHITGNLLSFGTETRRAYGAGITFNGGTHLVIRPFPTTPRLAMMAAVFSSTRIQQLKLLIQLFQAMKLVEAGHLQMLEM